MVPCVGFVQQFVLVGSCVPVLGLRRESAEVGAGEGQSSCRDATVMVSGCREGTVGRRFAPAVAADDLYHLRRVSRDDWTASGG